MPVTLPFTGSGDATAECASEEITTLNGAGVSPAQSVQRTALTLITASATAVDLPGDATNGAKVQLPAATVAALASAANQATGNASLSSIDGKTPALGQALAAASVPVVLTAAQLATLTPTAGAATEAKQDTIIGHLDGVEGLLGTIDADTGALAAIDFATGADIAADKTIKQSLSASSAVTIDLSSLASDTNLLAGRESTAIDNSSTQAVDYLLAGKIRQGTSPTTAKKIRVYVVGMLNDTTWPDVFDGTDSAETASSVGVLNSVGRLAVEMATNATSDFDNYFGPVSVASLFGGFLPLKFSVFVTHDTGVNLNSTAGNHVISVTPRFLKIVA